MKYFIQGKGEIELTRADFKAEGGEGSIYAKGAHAYKIYADARRMIPHAKIHELASLSSPNIIRPLDVVLDSRNNPVGYSMRHVADAYALCQLFPKAFRQRMNLTPETVLRLVQRFQEGVCHTHARGILIVDLNEMNFLVARDFGEIFFIDVDSYQTPSFAATALMESVRDRHARSFSMESDWFSFAVISFQMFTGIHPYKGTYAPMQNTRDKAGLLDARMRANISVLHNGVSVPASCLPFDVIPPAYMDWYRAVLDEGKRLPPPSGAQYALVVANTHAPLVERYEGGDHFEMTEWREFDSDVLSHDGTITLTRQSVYFDSAKYPKPDFDARFALTPRARRLVRARVDGAEVKFQDMATGREFVPAVRGEELMLCDGRFYVKQGEHLLEVEWTELAQSTLPSFKTTANVMMNATNLFDGVAIQNLLGACYAAIPATRGACYQVRLRELDGYRIIDARYYRNVLIVVASKAGRYEKLIFRFAADFSAHDARIIHDVDSAGINFTVLDSGIVLHLTDEGELEIFHAHVNSAPLKSISDAAFDASTKLFHVGTQALIARGNKLYKLKMRRS